ncbi:hypothetical protein [Pararhizobium haloflavum]|uniref:hypothetical protein n=1 Tax=Pararhizobium haloflavum TaxID=2037914 RepID=UPI000C19234B|nr:hypothetical protein [Pararhizobium haloflavum]
MNGRDDPKQRAGRQLSTRGNSAATASTKGEIDRFLSAARTIAPQAGGGRLVFALDATMSRQPTWDAACRLQAQMFDAVGAAGNLSVQLVYFRGYGECRASRWVNDTSSLRDLMTRIDCRGGQTQIGKVLHHIAEETQRKPVSAAVVIGDAMEEEIDVLCHRAGELGLRKVPCFMFQEGQNPAAHQAFAEIARLSGGAHVRFDANAADQLAELLKAVATYASGGLKALESARTRGSRLLLQQLSSRPSRR